MKKILTGLLILGSILSYAGEKNIITVGKDVISSINASTNLDIIASEGDVVVLKATNETMREITEVTHDSFGRCGGFIYHETFDDARKSLVEKKETKRDVKYSITKDSVVEKGINEVKTKNIESFIRKLSSYKNRYYQSETGEQAALMIKESWAQILGEKGTSELFRHQSWRQPSVIATIKGNKYPDEVIVIGGHLDSIAGWFDRSNATAPGADDNASGVATITETMRVLMATGYAPERTIKFMGYAAEEVGLRGSGEIAKAFSDAKIDVIGVLQLDMTNFKGDDVDIFLVSDYTNQEQNSFLKKLAEKYVKVKVGETTCGYACSDHASWHRNGYRASTPFESSKNNMNNKIHTSEDLISMSGDNAEHAAKFSKLAVAYAIELSK